MNLVNSEKSVTTERLIFFSDGVFAIAITLLVLGITVPELSTHSLTSSELTQKLFLLWPKILSYIISFSIIGIFWLGHHIMFLYIKRVNRNLILLNIFCLMIIAFFPFPAALLGLYTNQQPVIFLYGATLFLIGVVFLTMWWYGAMKKKFISKDIDSKLVSKGFYILLFGTVSYLLALSLSFFNSTLTLFLYILIPIFYLIPSPIDDFLQG